MTSNIGIGPAEAAQLLCAGSQRAMIHRRYGFGAESCAGALDCGVAGSEVEIAK